MQKKRAYSWMDNLLINIDQAVQTLVASPTATRERPNPADTCAETKLSTEQSKHAAGLMRVNHAGEVCAQALYQGQALTAHNEHVREELVKAAKEEGDHLAWCSQRITELNSHTSYLNPLWYIGSLAIGATAGLIGDRISLGFLAETERQVEQHLTEHLHKLPLKDHKSRCIVEQMRQDEIGHAHTAMQAGAAELPAPVKFAMTCMSKVMTVTAYWI